jgi:hypothetical protein
VALGCYNLPADNGMVENLATEDLKGGGFQSKNIRKRFLRRTLPVRTYRYVFKSTR